MKQLMGEFFGIIEYLFRVVLVAIYLGKVCAYEAELWDVIAAVNLAREKGWNALWLESD
ncbi:hypothetical protein PanWU01x14_279070, partial [Parasponia andersonii]